MSPVLFLLDRAIVDKGDGEPTRKTRVDGQREREKAKEGEEGARLTFRDAKCWAGSSAGTRTGVGIAGTLP